MLLKVQPAILKRGYIPISLFLAFTFVSNVFFSHGKVLFHLGPAVITEEGFGIAALRTLRVFFMVAGAKIITATTSLDSLVEALGNTLRPLEKIGLPVKDFFSTMGLTLKCFPRLKEYLTENYRNQKDKQELKGFLGKAKIISLFLVPMFVQGMQTPEMFFKEELKEEKNG